MADHTFQSHATFFQLAHQHFLFRKTVYGATDALALKLCFFDRS